MSDITPTPAAPAQETVIEPIALPKKKYRVELEFTAEDIDFVAVSIRVQKLLAPLADVRVGKTSITEIHEKEKKL